MNREAASSGCRHQYWIEAMPGVGAAIRMEPRWTGVDRGAPRARKPPGESCRRETPPGNSPDQSRSMPRMTVRIGNADGVVGFPEEHVAEREIERLVSGDRTKSLVPYCDGPIAERVASIE